jgi:hypothetical protein
MDALGSLSFRLALDTNTIAGGPVAAQTIIVLVAPSVFFLIGGPVAAALASLIFGDCHSITPTFSVSVAARFPGCSGSECSGCSGFTLFNTIFLLSSLNVGRDI